MKSKIIIGLILWSVASMASADVRIRCLGALITIKGGQPAVCPITTRGVLAPISSSQRTILKVPIIMSFPVLSSGTNYDDCPKFAIYSVPIVFQDKPMLIPKAIIGARGNYEGNGEVVCNVPDSQSTIVQEFSSPIKVIAPPPPLILPIAPFDPNFGVTAEQFRARLIGAGLAY